MKVHVGSGESVATTGWNFCGSKYRITFFIPFIGPQWANVETIDNTVFGNASPP
jgi:hypothetical protein